MYREPDAGEDDEEVWDHRKHNGKWPFLGLPCFSVDDYKYNFKIRFRVYLLMRQWLFKIIFFIF